MRRVKVNKNLRFQSETPSIKFSFLHMGMWKCVKLKEISHKDNMCDIIKGIVSKGDLFLSTTIMYNKSGSQTARIIKKKKVAYLFTLCRHLLCKSSPYSHIMHNGWWWWKMLSLTWDFPHFFMWKKISRLLLLLMMWRRRDFLDYHLNDDDVLCCLCISWLFSSQLFLHVEFSTCN